MVALEQVREQYEELPYPPRNPEDERERLVSNQPSQLLLNQPRTVPPRIYRN